MARKICGGVAYVDLETERRSMFVIGSVLKRAVDEVTSENAAKQRGGRSSGLALTAIGKSVGQPQ